MRLYLPMSEDEEIEICWNDSKVTLIPTEGCLDLTGLMGRWVPFTIVRGGTPLLTTKWSELCELEQTLRVVKGETCIAIYVDGGEYLSPLSPTRVFYSNDFQMVVFLELTGVQYDTPLTISWLHQGKIHFGMVSTIPAAHGDNFDEYCRKYATGFILSPETPKGRWTVIVRLLTGKVLYCAEISLLDQKRTVYGANLGVFSQKNQGGIINELVE